MVDSDWIISIGISDKGLFWGRGHLMTLGGAFLALPKCKMLDFQSQIYPQN